MKKSIMFVILGIFIFCMGSIDVYANYLNPSDYNLECIYNDGGLYTEEVGTDDNNIINRLSYNLNGTAQTDANKGGSTVFINELSNSVFQDIPDNIMGPAMPLYKTCHSYVTYLTYDNASYYKFGYDIVCSESECKDLDASRSGWCVFWGCGAEYKAAVDAAKNQKAFTLVSERYLLGDNAPEADIILYYMMPAEQAAGSNAYIKIHIYDNVILLEKDGRITRLDEGNIFSNKTINVKITENGEYQVLGAPKNIYINSPEPIPITNSSSTISYRINETKYSVSDKKDSSHPYKYILTDEVLDSNKIDDSLCTERLKNTSPILIKIIQYMQILIPMLVIVLTGLDIGKMVVAGNLEEELPKKKKMIIARLIVMLAFFFLPLFTKVLIKIIKSTGAKNVDSILYIDCLFSNGGDNSGSLGNVDDSGKSSDNQNGNDGTSVDPE